MFGDTAASLQATADRPAATEQPPAAQAPRGPDPAPGTGPRGASRPPILAEWPPDLFGFLATPERPTVEAPPEQNAPTFVGVKAKPRRPSVEAPPEPAAPTFVGVMAKPRRPSVEAPPEPAAPTFVGVMAKSGPANKVEPADDWRTRADAYVLAVAFGDARRPIAGRGAAPAVRIETRRAGAIQPVPAAGSADLRREAPRAVEQVDGPVLRKLPANRPRPVSGRRS
jgi:hypothetical protein